MAHGVRGATQRVDHALEPRDLHEPRQVHSAGPCCPVNAAQNAPPRVDRTSSKVGPCVTLLDVEKMMDAMDSTPRPLVDASPSPAFALDGPRFGTETLSTFLPPCTRGIPPPLRT